MGMRISHKTGNGNGTEWIAWEWEGNGKEWQYVPDHLYRTDCMTLCVCLWHVIRAQCLSG